MAPSRKRIAIAAAAASLPLGFALLVLRAFLPWTTRLADGRWLLGARSRFPRGSATLLRRAKAIVVHDELGLRALSSICTHQRCNLGVASARREIVCSCHGAAFDYTGNVKRPPATEPLPWLELRDEAGELVLDPSRRVTPE